MRRRGFIAGLAGAVTWPVASRAQQSVKVLKVGVLGPSPKVASTARGYRAFARQLEHSGFVEHRNLEIEYHRVDDPRGTFTAANELMRAKPDLVFVNGPEIGLKAIISAGHTTPIVIMAVNYDPLARHYATSLVHPGGRITGLFYREPELVEKRIDILTQAFPQKRRLAILWDAISADQFEAAEQIARSQSLDIRPVKLEHPPYDFARAFESMAGSGAEMALIFSSPYFTEHRPLLAKLAIQHRLPCMFIFKAYVDAGGLMSYGVDQMTMYRGAGDYAGKILNGARPGDLPIERAAKFEMAINLKAAKSIDLTFPTSILLRADDVIE
jgi:putative ABC transport system substrate-binding protein